MGGNLKTVMAIAVIITLFLTTYIPRHNRMPQHVDAWILIAIADQTLKQGYYPDKEPWTGGGWSYPPGSHLLTAALSRTAGTDLLKIAQILPAVFFVILGLLNYSLAHSLFKKQWVALSIMVFTLLVVSNITMMGNYYLVPLAFGVITAFAFFNMLVREQWALSLITFAAVAFTHSSTFVFTLVATALYFLFEPAYRKRFKIIIGLILLAVVTLTITRGLFQRNLTFFLKMLQLSKSRPYFSFYFMATTLFIALTAFGFYLIIAKEKRARPFLIPLFIFLALDLFMYWNYKGFIILYRRLIYHIFLLVPFFVGYAVYAITEWLAKRMRWKKSKIPLAISLVVLAPIAANVNLEEHRYSEIYVNNQEHRLFTEFGQMNPGQFVATNHLQAYALPYYLLKPVQLSPGHISNISHFNELSPCYVGKDITCLEKFFNKTKPKYQYLYTGTLVNSTHFVPALNHSGLIIYQYESNLKQDQ